MPATKKIFTAILAIALLSVSGCSSEDGTVNVISGPGKANTSMLISFNELCSGTAEGFLGNSKLLASRKKESKLLYSEVDTETGTKREIYSKSFFKVAPLEIAPDGSKFLCDNRLVNIANGSVQDLPAIIRKTGKAAIDTTSLPSYSFTESSGLLLTDPLYYRPLQDGQSSLDTGISDGMWEYKDMELPDIASIKNIRLITDRLKFIFAAETHDSNTQLYLLDLYEKKFILMANNIKDYTLSPGRTIVAYVEDGKNGGSDKLATINIETGRRKELLSLPQIAAVGWSSNSGWIAYTGGGSKIDIGIIKADGSSNEQLTNGMHPYGKPVWSRDGKKLAFTSYDKEKGTSQKVYIITLNNQNESWGESYPEDKARTYAASQLLETLRFNTDLTLGKIVEEKK